MQPAHRDAIAGLMLALSILLAGTAGAQDEDWAPIMPRAAQSLMLDIARAGDRLVAVGERGHVLYSDDHGASWVQGRVPLRQMLTSVFFASPTSGWAAGHDGAILHTEDAGASWSRQRDGLKDQAQVNAAKLAQARTQLAAVERQLQDDPENDALADELEQAQLELEDAQWLRSRPVFAPPLMDIWFADAREGWAVGAFGTALHTADGGAHWQDIRSRLANPDELHYNAITGDGAGRLLIAGESGRLYRSLDGGRSWQQLASPWEGSWFGVLYLPRRDRVLVFGLEGMVFRSDDFGDTWQAADVAADTSFAGGFTDGEQEVVLVGGVGTVALSHDGGQVFNLAAQRLPGSLSAIVRTRTGDYVAAGMGGVHLLPAPVTEATSDE